MGVDRVVPSMGANVGDIDNDGFLDVYLGTGAPSFGSLIPNILLRNDAGRRFDDVTEATGTGHLQKGHGVAFADLDQDGDQDIVLNAGGAVPGDRYDDAVFENPGTPGQHWIALRLIGATTNRAAIGARIRVRLAAPPGASAASAGSRLRYREVSSGGSFGSNSYTQHVGLGRATAIEAVDVTWPVSGKTQTFRNPPIDTLLEITEGVEAPVVRPRKPFRLGRADGLPPRARALIGWRPVQSDRDCVRRGRVRRGAVPGRARFPLRQRRRARSSPRRRTPTPSWRRPCSCTRPATCSGRSRTTRPT